MICEKSLVDCTVQMVPGMLKLKEIPGVGGGVGGEGGMIFP